MQIFQILDYSSHRTHNPVPSPVCSDNKTDSLLSDVINVTFKKMQNEPCSVFYAL